jgi:riboflavin kinase/FMN adenylyltransferase
MAAFSGVEDLVAQMDRDVARTREVMGVDRQPS